MTTRTRPTITCTACGKQREHRARGWCQACYRRWRYRGRPADGPPPARPLMDHNAVRGTLKGRDWHTRRGTPVCQECRDAYNAYCRTHYARRRQLRQDRTVWDDWTDQQQHVAAVAAGRAENADDCRLLLEALGLIGAASLRKQPEVAA